jgi:uncharacterized phage protein (TIGR01671 family)
VREHKFRGKRIDNGELVHGDLLQDNDCGTASICGFDYYVDEEGPQREDYCVSINPETVGEFTGLKDKNGVEGCQDDILDTSIGKAVIKLGEYGGAGDIEHYHIGFYVDFLDQFTNRTCRHELGYWLPQSAICGNIHNNPELLAGEQS